MSCKDNCTGESFTTAYSLHSVPSTTIEICRPLTYYVNPNSEQVMELGTIEYPFRDINLVFLELNNHHQHTNRTINIYVMEATSSYLAYEFIQIVNITQVNIDTYTDNSLNDPKSINFRLIDDMYDMHTTKTLFNIVQNTTKNEIDISRMDEHEIGDLTQQTFVMFHIHRSSITFNHVDVHSHFTKDDTSIWYVYSSY